MAKKDETPETKDKPKAAPKGDVLVLVRRNGPYSCQMHEKPDGGGSGMVGGGVAKLKVTHLRVWPGANYRAAALVDKVLDQPGLQKRITAGEVEIWRGKWVKIPKAKRLELALKTCDPDTLDRLVTEETDPEVAEALDLQLQAGKGAKNRAGRSMSAGSTRP